jgi:hypothetical protein
MDATGQNMCEYKPTSLPYKWQVFYAAMNEADWNAIGGKSSVCGRCLAVRGMYGQTTPGFQIKTVYVKIVDQCPDWACERGSVDFSTTALQAITGYGWDKKRIEWEYVDCPTVPSATTADGYAKAIAAGTPSGDDIPSDPTAAAAAKEAMAKAMADVAAKEDAEMLAAAAARAAAAVAEAATEEASTNAARQQANKRAAKAKAAAARASAARATAQAKAKAAQKTAAARAKARVARGL